LGVIFSFQSCKVEIDPGREDLPCVIKFIEPIVPLHFNQFSNISFISVGNTNQCIRWH